MDWTIWDVFWSMIFFFFWVTYLWMFITIFGDILRRSDLGGWAKAGWLIVIIFLHLLGLLIYMIARPKMTPEDKKMLEEAIAFDRRTAGYSAADEIAKLHALKEKGVITQEEFTALKLKASS